MRMRNGIRSVVAGRVLTLVVGTDLGDYVGCLLS